MGMKGNTVWEHKHGSSDCTRNASPTGHLAMCQLIGRVADRQPGKGHPEEGLSAELVGTQSLNNS